MKKTKRTNLSSNEFAKESLIANENIWARNQTSLKKI